jgi:polysaccharide chain length determinant protein (PEP-CTERM system associated)
MEQMPMTPGDYVEILKRRKWSLILPFLIISLGAVIVALALPAVYSSSSTILIEEQEIPVEFVMTTVTSYAEQRIQAIQQRIMSFSRLLEIIERFNLYPELRAKRTNEEIVAKMREDTSLKMRSAETVDQRTRKAATATIAFSLSYEGQHPRQVQQIASVLTSLFLEENLKVREKAVAETSEFLESEMAKIQKDLTAVESRIADFKRKHMNQLPNMMQANLQSLNDIERNIEQIRTNLLSLTEREQFLETQLTTVPPRIEDEEESAARKRLEELRLQLVHLTKRFSDEYPDVIKVRAEIAELETQLEETGASPGSENDSPNNPTYITMVSQLAGIRTEIGTSELRLVELEKAAEAMRGRIAASPEVEEAYNTLISTRNSLQAKYDDLMRKLMEARVAHGLEKEQKGERFVLLESPRVPEKPFKPNRLAIMLVGLMLGIGAGTALAVLREFSDDAVRNADYLATATQFPVLAGIPLIMTPEDINRRRRKRIGVTLGAVGLIAVGVLVFHFLVMDLDVFWAILMRRLAI